MNQQTLKRIYKEQQPEQYFGRYFKNAKQREDGRKFSEHRPLKIAVNNNDTVSVSRGQTIIVCQYKPLNYDPNSQQLAVSQGSDQKPSPSKGISRVIKGSESQETNAESTTQQQKGCLFGGRPLLELQVELPIKSTTQSVARQVRENAKSSCSVQSFLDRNIDWTGIEKQLAVQTEKNSNRYYAHTAQIHVRVINADGLVKETVLVAVQLLLLIHKFQKIDSETGCYKRNSCNQTEHFTLEITRFIFPFKYCEVFGETLVDPSQSEEQNCSFEVVVLGDILASGKNRTEGYQLLQKIKKMDSFESETKYIESIISLWKIQMQKFLFDLEALKDKIISQGIEEQIPINIDINFE